MQLKKSIFILAWSGVIPLVACHSIGAADLLGKSAAGAENQINVTADKLSTADGSTQIEASGNVELKRQEMTLKGDQVRFNRATQDVDAKGNVSVDDPEWKVKSASSLQLNMGAETGVIQDGDLFLEDGHVSMSGRRFEKFGGQTYHVDDGFFTTCLCDSGAPSWKFSAEQMDLALEGSGTIRNGYFYVLDTPVLYIPYGIFPLRSERQTGLLFPNFGHSTVEGFRLLQPFFWAISKSTDATVTMDVETRARIGILGELRSVLSREADFRIESSYFNENLRKNADSSVVDKTIADPTIPKNRWSVIGTHRYTTSSDWQTFSDISGFSDDLFARELVERFDLPGPQELNIRRSRYGDSRFGLFRNWDDTFFKGQFNFFQDFIQYDKGTLQRTPQLSAWGNKFLSGFPLEFRWRAESVNYIRRVGGDGLRLDLRPELVAPFRAGPYAFGSMSVAPRETLYHLYTSVKPSDHNVSRELVEIRGNLGTSLSRVYTFDRPDLIGMKHVLEPEISYLFIPKVDQSAIPIMDDIDRIGRRNVVTFALTNRLWGKSQGRFASTSAEKEEMLNTIGAGNVRDLGIFSTALSYDLDRAEKGASRLSDLDMKLRMDALSYLSMGFGSTVHTGPWKVSSMQAYFSLRDPRPLPRRIADPDFIRSNFIALGYAFVRNNPNSFYAEDANINLDAPADCTLHPADPRCPGANTNQSVAANVSTSALYHLTDNILLYGTTNVDARQGRFLGFTASTKFLSFCECWSVTLGLRQNLNPKKTSFNFDFNLAGLGNQKSSLK
jgi:LPS-assembly protein